MSTCALAQAAAAGHDQNNGRVQPENCFSGCQWGLALAPLQRAQCRHYGLGGRKAINEGEDCPAAGSCTDACRRTSQVPILTKTSTIRL